MRNIRRAGYQLKYFIYTFILLILVSIGFYQKNLKFNTLNISELEFKQKILSQNDVAKLEPIIDESMVRVYIIKDSLYKKTYKDLINDKLQIALKTEAPHFQFSYSKIKDFEDNYKKYLSDHPYVREVPIEIVTNRNFLDKIWIDFRVITFFTLGIIFFMVLHYFNLNKFVALKIDSKGVSSLNKEIHQNSESEIIKNENLSDYKNLENIIKSAGYHIVVASYRLKISFVILIGTSILNYIAINNSINKLNTIDWSILYLMDFLLIGSSLIFLFLGYDSLKKAGNKMNFK